MKLLKNIDEIKSQIILNSDAHDLIFLGRAATAMLIAYKAIVSKYNIAEPEIILPAISCATPVNVALMSGLKPRFADIDLETGLTNLEYIQKRYTKNTVAVVFIHSYGNTQDLLPIRKWCDLNNIILIEDNAQALGAYLPCGNPVGFYGDFSIYSFNLTKTIETGGGALVIKNKKFTDICNSIYQSIFSSSNKVSIEKKSMLSLIYRNLHHSFVMLDRINISPKIDNFFGDLQSVFEPLNIAEYIHNDKFISEWNNLDNINSLRVKNAAIYSEQLIKYSNFKIISNFQQSKVCWRYSLLIEDENSLISISENVRKDGFHLSNLYWPLNYFFKSDDLCPNASSFARKIINLWVDKSVNELYIKNCTESLIKHTLAT